MCDNADILVILTEWNQFRALDLNKLKTLLKNPIVIDLRNIYNPIEMKQLGFFITHWEEKLNNNKKHFFHKSIIREYDIRGIYGETLFDEDAKILGNLFGIEVGKNETVNVGFDGRLSSPNLKKISRGFN